MKFVKEPNLPINNVKYALCDSRIGDSIKKELNTLGCNPILLPVDNTLDVPISAHPDIHLFHSGDGGFITSNFYFEIFNSEIKNLGSKIDCEFFNNRRVEKEITKGYPSDVLLNVVEVGKYLIGNKSTASEMITTKKTSDFINVNQGYTKCSVCVVSDEAIITDDAGIYKAVKKYLDVLLISRGEIILEGYNYGFFGGSCGKISKDTLAFYGSVEQLSDFENINSFCRHHNVYCYSLSNCSLTDYGSLIPLLE